jgi:signal transduction histidine kinase
LSGAIFELKAAETSVGGSPVALQLNSIRGLLHQLETGLRDVIQDLQPAELEPGGLIRAIEDEAERLQTRYSIRCSVRAAGHHRPLPPAVEAAVLRIVREALENVQRHASASTVLLTVTVLKSEVRLTISDDGIGVDPGRSDDGRLHLGISGMRRRAEARGGSFAIESRRGEGTTISVTIPARSHR